MPYGTLKVDNITYTSAGVDATTTVSGLVEGGFPNISITGTISGATITGNIGEFTTITAVTGIFTTTLSGASITGGTVVGTSIVSGATVTGGVIGVGTNVTFPDGTTQTTAAVTTADTATTTGIQTFTAAQRGAVVVVPYATGISLDLSSGNNYQITLTGSTVLQNPTNIVSGQAGIVTLIQGTASNTVAFATGWQYPGGSGSTPTVTATSGAVDLLVYYTKDDSSVAFRLVQDIKA
jgi:hypothetical protein